eukprot:s87_g3.t1
MGKSLSTALLGCLHTVCPQVAAASAPSWGPGALLQQVRLSDTGPRSEKMLTHSVIRLDDIVVEAAFRQSKASSLSQEESQSARKALGMLDAGHQDRPAWGAGESRGLFLVFEGLDRSGKSTQSKKIASYLEKAGPVKWMKKMPSGHGSPRSGDWRPGKSSAGTRGGVAQVAAPRASCGDERYENAQVQANVRAQFRDQRLRSNVNWRDVDGARDVEVIHAEIRDAVDSILQAGHLRAVKRLWI